MNYIAQVPANIALIKYWGKSNSKQQWPANNSLSMTLSQCFTTTAAKISKDNSRHEFIFMDKILTADNPFCYKIFSHLKMLEHMFSFKRKLIIKSHNNFPAAAGIASSASGFAALTLASLCAWTNSMSWKDLEKNKIFLTDIIQLSRLGSGSSCRSLMGGYVRWDRGKNPEQQNVTQIFSHKHWQLADTVILISNKAKKISSSTGHELAWSSPLFSPRLAVLKERETKLSTAIAKKDITTLGETIEQEALEMHAIMMSSKEPVCYFTQDTIKLLTWIRELRIKNKINIYFTLDAGPNIHVISETKTQDLFIRELKKYNPSIKFIKDQVGNGPTINYSK